MKFCMQCGHQLGASRTCPGCGATRAVEPPPAPQLPPAGVRYPLFADEVDSVQVNTSGRVITAVPDEPPTRPGSPEATALRLPAISVVPPRRGVSATVWLVLALLVVGALVLGSWLLLRGGSSSPEAHRSGASASSAPGSAGDAAATATAKAPVTRAPGVDTQGNRTSYDAANMVDGDPTTAWEMPGDGAGTELTFRLARSTHLTEVGLVNGYAKTAAAGGGKVDWYAGNRRVLSVEWLFDDGTSVPQDLRQTRTMQSTSVDVTTRTVRLRLVHVSKPGKGPAGRNMTALSEVRLGGSPS
jgi:hypothetical protein